MEEYEWVAKSLEASRGPNAQRFPPIRWPVVKAAMPAKTSSIGAAMLSASVL